MRLLLDTHIVIGSFQNKLNARLRHALERADKCFVSLVSLWEIEIKKSLGKLDVPENFYTILERTTLSILPLSLSQIQRISALPRHHGDPFDRMLIAQAQVEGLTLVTEDKEFSLYNVSVL